MASIRQKQLKSDKKIKKNIRKIKSRIEGISSTNPLLGGKFTRSDKKRLNKFLKGEIKRKDL